MSLSKCFPWFGGHSVVQTLALRFEFYDTPNPGGKKTSWSQILDGVMWNGEKKDFFSSEIALFSVRKQIHLLFRM